MRANSKWRLGQGPTARRFAALLVSLALLVPVPGLLLTPAGLAVTACEGFVSWSAGSYTCLVSPGITSLEYTVVGGPGGGIMQSGQIITPGGTAAQVKGTLSVTPGETLYLTVGGWGTNSGSYGASGGGYSALARVVDATTIPIVVAGGGGGAGPANPEARGGNGGTTGTGGGGDGGSDTHPAGYAGGTAPTGGAGGNAGYGPGGNGGTYPTSVSGTANYSGGGGAFGGNGGGGLIAGGYAGGGGANTSGGGGGGGYGGGGGGTLAYNGTTYGTGGGGGSSLVPSGGTASLAVTGSGVLLAARPDAPSMSAPTPSVNMVSLSWTAPASNGGATITGYNVYQGTTSGGEAATAVNGTTLITATSYEVGGLTNDTTYYFVVTAVNRIGEGPASNEVSATPTAVVPTAPVMHAPSATAGQVTLSWDPPSYDGGATVTGYSVYQGTTRGGEGASPVNSEPITGTSTTITGLTNGTTYYFTVKARNSAGIGAASAEASAVPGARYLYYRSGAGTIGRAELGGSNSVTNNFITGLGADAPYGIAVDGQHIYWTVGMTTYSSTSGWIGRANLDGTGVDNHWIATGGSDWIAVDGGHIYWSNSYNGIGCTNESAWGSIGRADLNGDNANQCWIKTWSYESGTGGYNPQGVAVDPSYIYWSVEWSRPGDDPPAVMRAHIDGSGLERISLIAGAGEQPEGVAVDAANAYWAKACTNHSIGYGALGRSELNGANANGSFFAGMPCPIGVAVSGSTLYFSNWSTGRIGALPTNGSSTTPTWLTGVTGDWGVAVGVGVNPGATHFALTAPATVTAGTPISVTVTAKDALENTVTDYAGTVHFSSSDGTASLPADATLTNGTGTFNVTLRTAGSQTITATDTVTSTITGASGSISVAAPPTCASAGSTPITSMAELQAINAASTLANGRYQLMGRYCLTANLDASGFGNFTPIGGPALPFTGYFDGEGHTISNLTIDLPSSSWVGLFGFIASGAQVKNVGLVNATVHGSDSTGGLAGENAKFVESASGGTVTNVYVTGTVTGTQNTGGLVGVNQTLSSITSSYSTATVSGTYNVGGLVGSNAGPITAAWSSGSVTATGQNVGGLVGNNMGSATSAAFITRSWSSGSVSGANATGGLVGLNANGTVDKSYSSANVTGSGSGAGGLVGYNNTFTGGHATVQNSYSTGSVGGSGSIRGGLVGANGLGSYIQVSYSTGTVSGAGTSVGGLVGSNNGPTTTANSYWDAETSGQAASQGGTSRTHDQMLQSGNFGGFDFGVVWSIANGVTNPYFKWQAPVIASGTPVPGAPSVTTDGNVTVTFGTAMSASSFTDSTFYLTPLGSATHIAAALSLSADNLTATLNPSANLSPATTYTVTVVGGSDGVRDASGNALAVPGSGPYAGMWHWTFTTGSCANNGTAITTMTQLQGIGGSTGPLSGTYCLANDLTATDPFTPIGTSSAPFMGIFDGQGHTISNLTIDLPSTANVGLFGFVGDGTGSGIIANVGLVNASVSGAGQTGGLVGWLSGSYESPVVNIFNSYTTGSVHGHDSTGGLVGFDQWGNVTSSFSAASVYGWANTGGLVGQNHATITMSYSTGAVQGSYMGIGGLVGSNYGPVANSYATGNVTGSNNWVGGLVGYTSASVTYSYSTGKVTQTAGYYAGGFAGWNLNPQNMHSYWDTQTSWRGNGLGGFNGAVTGLAGLTDSGMRQQASFSGWDFTNVWTIDEGSTYPYLRWQAGPAGVVPSIFALPAGVTVIEGQPASFTAAAGGNPAPTLQWQQSTDGGTTWADIPGATTSPLSFTAQLGQTGYGYRAVFGNASGTAISGAVTLTVTPGTTATAISAVSGSGDYGVTASVSATLKAGATALSGKTISFTLNGSAVGSAETDADGVATLDAVYLGSIGAGTHTGYIGASFAGDATYAASGPVTGDLVVAKAYQAALSITGPSSATFGDEDATISTTGGSGTGAITFSVGISTACSIASGKLHVTSGTGDCTLVATKAADANHYMTASQGWPVTVAKAAQGTLGITAGQTFPYASSGTFTPTTTGGSGTGAVTFTSSTASICTASGSTAVTIVAAGTCSLTAVKAGDDDYDASATSASQDVVITVPLTATAISAVSGSGTYAGDGTVTATLLAGTSPVGGVMMSFSRNGMPLGSATTDESGVATLPASMGSIPAGTHAGYVVAWFTGDETYAASGPVSGDLVVAKAGQSISFTAPTDVHYGETIFSLGATADSSLTVAYASLTTSVCTFEAPPASGLVALMMAPVGPQLRIVGVGECTVRASQAGDANYDAAAVVDRTFTTQKAHLSVTADADTITADVDHFGRLYGEPNPVFDVRYAGFVNAEGPEDLDGTLGFETTATSTSDVGAYAVTPAGLTSSNYEITFVAGVLDIGKADPGLAFDLSSLSKTVDDVDFSVAADATSASAGTKHFTLGTASVGCIVSDAGLVHITGTATGTESCVISVSQDATTNYSAGGPVVSRFHIEAPPLTPTTISAVSGSGTYAGTATLTATLMAGTTALSGKTMAFTLNGTSVGSASTGSDGVATLSGVSLTGIGAGGHTGDVGASFAGDATYAATGPVTGDLSVAMADQATLSITGPSSATYGDADATIGTSGGSGTGDVTFSAGTSSACSIVSGKLHVVSGTGTCSLTATKASDGNYNAATSAAHPVTIGKALLSVTADADPTTMAIDHFARAHDAADPTFTVRYAGFVNGDDAADLGGTLDFDTESVTSSSVGAYDVTPLGLTSSTYEITFVAGVLDIGIAGQSISFTAPTGVRYGDSNRALGATATSGLSVSYASSTETVCVIVGGDLHVEAAGSCTVTASQGGNSDHEAATPVSRTFTIGKASQSITFAELPDRTYGDPDFAVSATASSGLTVHFHASGSCTIDGTTVHLTAAGSCAITAHQDGDPNYEAATAVIRTFDSGPAVGTVAYIGQTLVVTSGPKSTTAQVRLTASVVGTAGDISTARVTFMDDAGGVILARGIRVSPVTGSSTPTGTATVTVTLGSGKFGAQGYLIRVVLDTSSGSSYTNENQLDDPTSAAFATLSVIVPGGTNTAKGDADITPVAAAGTYGAASGVHYTIGLKYNKGGSSPQGQIFLTFDLDGYRYYVKSNAISSIACTKPASPCRDMTIYTKASIYRVDGSGVTTSLDGNVTLRIDAHDAGGTGTTGDTIGFTVLSSKTGLLYWSNNWAYDADAKAWRTILQAVSATGGVAVQMN